MASKVFGYHHGLTLSPRYPPAVLLPVQNKDESSSAVKDYAVCVASAATGREAVVAVTSCSRHSSSGTVQTAWKCLRRHHYRAAVLCVVSNQGRLLG
ncbi:unnamed protein product [Ectocarpus sp. CCAP 1310/34]|nr:unnamed protein product [Ectocarpus sp. CCAP 1310/34]